MDTSYHVDMLPIELWMYILEMQDDLVAIVNISETCWFFRNLINSDMLMKFVEKIIFVDVEKICSYWTDMFSEILRDYIQISDVPYAIHRDYYEEYKMNLQKLEKGDNCYINQQTERLCYLAMKRGFMTLKDVEHKTPQLCELGVKTDWRNLRYVNAKNQTIKIMDYALQKVHHKTVSYDNYTRCQLEFQSICLELAYSGGLALKYIANQTKDICRIAIKQNPYALKYIANQTKEICRIAIKHNPYTLKYIDDQTEYICMLAIQRDPYTIQYVKKHTLKICTSAMKINPNVSKYIRNHEIPEIEKYSHIRSFESIWQDIMNDCFD